eukprot:16434780-Heterocapsa_arctica.AAC.1
MYIECVALLAPQVGSCASAHENLGAQRAGHADDCGRVRASRRRLPFCDLLAEQPLQAGLAEGA